ncbi:MAG TPA: DUF4124 domain-containing protein [Methylomirabilota bacterium]|nr:DUF4124 domain-containing protein [Methylomirabilota bacterium]
MKHYQLVILSSLLLLLSSAPARGQNIYQWTDARGRIHYSNAPVDASKAIDDDLPPATHFGGESGPAASPEEAPPPAEPKAAVQPPQTETTPLTESDEPAGAEPASGGDAEPTPEQAPATAEDSPVEPLPQASAEFSERESEDASSIDRQNPLSAVDMEASDANDDAENADQEEEGGEES